MESYHVVAISIGVVMIAFSLLTIISFIYCIYVMCEARINQSTNGSGTETVKTEKSASYSRQTTWSGSVDYNPKTRLSSDPSIV